MLRGITLWEKVARFNPSAKGYFVMLLRTYSDFKNIDECCWQLSYHSARQLSFMNHQSSISKMTFVPCGFVMSPAQSASALFAAQDGCSCSCSPPLRVPRLQPHHQHISIRGCKSEDTHAAARIRPCSLSRHTQPNTQEQKSDCVGSELGASLKAPSLVPAMLFKCLEWTALGNVTSIP